MHTSVGPKKGRGVQHFWEKSCKLDRDVTNGSDANRVEVDVA